MAHKLVFALITAVSLYGQAQPALQFEVASVKAAAQQGPSMIQTLPGGERFVAKGIPLKFMIQSAYRVNADQIAGGPDWIERDPFDLEAKAEHVSTRLEMLVMLQSLLAERFQLRFHKEIRELPVYILSVEKDGPKAMTPHEPENPSDPLMQMKSGGAPLQLQAEGHGASMDYLTRVLRAYMDRMIVDQTGLKGGYDFHLAFTRTPPVSMQPGSELNGRPIDFSGPTLVQAIRQQMGLRLEAGKAPVQVMVIESASKPSAN